MESYDIILLILIAPIIYMSAKAFKDPVLYHKLMFNPSRIKYGKEWYRFFTVGLVHADWMHLIFNVYVLWIFGDLVMMIFNYLWGIGLANLAFIGLFIPALAVSGISTYLKYKENPNYNAVGASGAVSAVVFASIILYPEGRMGLLFIPVMIPSWLFGLLYLAFTAYMDKKQIDNVGHNAHFWGSIYGIAYVLLIKPDSFIHFAHVVMGLR